MKHEFTVAQANGDILVDNSFETTRGKYRVIIYKYHGDIFFFKYRDDKLLECQNLSKVGAKGDPKNGRLV